jgi:hypothetical protein
VTMLHTFALVEDLSANHSRSTWACDSLWGTRQTSSALAFRPPSTMVGVQLPFQGLTSETRLKPSTVDSHEERKNECRNKDNVKKHMH